MDNLLLLPHDIIIIIFNQWFESLDFPLEYSLYELKLPSPLCSILRDLRIAFTDNIRNYINVLVNDDASELSNAEYLKMIFFEQKYERLRNDSILRLIFNEARVYLAYCITDKFIIQLRNCGYILEEREIKGVHEYFISHINTQKPDYVGDGRLCWINNHANITPDTMLIAFEMLFKHHDFKFIIEPTIVYRSGSRKSIFFRPNLTRYQKICHYNHMRFSSGMYCIIGRVCIYIYESVDSWVVVDEDV